jgi:hypothetical protein
MDNPLQAEGAARGLRGFSFFSSGRKKNQKKFIFFEKNLQNKNSLYLCIHVHEGLML